MVDCLSCKWLQEFDAAHKWHECIWPVPARVPSSIQVIRATVNVQAPWRDCPAWEAIT